MGTFDEIREMVVINPFKWKKISQLKEVIIIKECYCPNGHSLISDQATFDGYSGILLKVRTRQKEGIIALNPVYGLKHRFSSFPLVKDELLSIKCPECGIDLPVFSPCTCGGELITLFLDKKPQFANSLLICNRVDCQHAQIRFNNEVVLYDKDGNVIFG
ncbi:MAG TPA: hypothetical protein VK212_03905 [Lentimicrobium sp.]|nr:hypothetical protein [Lentimicrobium sp.]